MKILTVIPSYKPAYIYGGPVRSVAALCEALVTNGHEVTVLTTNANGKENLAVQSSKEIMIDGVKVYYFNRWTGDHSHLTPSLVRAFRRQCKQYDVIHIHSWWNLVTIPVMVVCLRNNIIPVFSPRGSITTYTLKHSNTGIKTLFQKLFGKRLLGKSVMHVTTQMELTDIRKLIQPKKTFIIPNILELPEPVPRTQESATIFKLMYLGRIDPKKNIEFLLDIVMEDFNIPFSLTIIGDGDHDYIESLKKRTSRSKSISWSEPVHSYAKWERLAAADLVLLPSFNENYGNVVIESLSQGTPVLISDQVGLKDFVLENRLGWVSECDPVKWHELLNKIYADKETRASIREKAPLILQRQLNPDKLTKEYLSMYEVVRQMNSANQ